MTATNLGLGGQPATFLGALVAQANTSLGLAQSPSTCTVTLAEDVDFSPPALFVAPEMGSYQRFVAGSLKFGGIVTSYQTDVANIGGRQITVNLSDPREIMKSIPLIIAPGYRTVAAEIATTNCSVIDVYGAFDSFGGTLNLSGWNQAGIPYEDIALAFSGGHTIRRGFDVFLNPQLGKAFGESYFFDLSEVTAKVDPGYRVNSNLINIADLIQELASKHSFDWFVESRRNATENRIDVTIRIIDRSVDNIDLDIDDFLAANSGFVVSASRGFELRNEVACSVLLGAPVEALNAQTITGLANNPIDLTTEGGADKYFMEEEEMRYVLAGKEWWKTWVELNGGLLIYSVGGAAKLAPLWSPGDASDVGNQLGVNPERLAILEADEETTGRLYDKLLGHAQSTYGKRFLFTGAYDVEYIDAAWTADAVGGNNDPDEYFRNSDGKTRCYVSFVPTNAITPTVDNPPSFIFGLGANAPQPLPLELRDSFNGKEAVTDIDKADWIYRQSGFGGGSLFVAGTIEEGNVVKLDAPVVIGTSNPDEGVTAVADAGPDTKKSTPTANQQTSASRNSLKRAMVKGESGGSLHQRAYQPHQVFVPTKSKFTRYGPVFASNMSPTSEGKLLIDQDDGFSPWEFGSFQLMLDAMQFKVDNSASNVKTVENANITIEGYPKLNIGDTIGKNSNVNNINISFGNGVQTTYELRSFLRQFGELTKEELASFSLFIRRGGARTFPQDSVSFINRYRAIITKQFGGKGSTSSGATVGGAGNFE
jgi:hypothetical protein